MWDNDLPRPVGGVVEQDVDEGLLLLKENGEYLVLNHTGATVWRALSKVQTVDEIEEELTRMKNAPSRQEIGSLVEKFLVRLRESGFTKA